MRIDSKTSGRSLFGTAGDLWRLLICIILSGMLPGALYAAPPAQSKVEELVELMSLEQLMSLEASSTSFFDTPIEKTPGSLYVVPRESLDFSYAVSLADYLAYYVPGAHISEFYDKGSLYSTRGISGGSNATTLFMLNSEMLNTRNGLSSNLNLPLLGYADRIEVLNGPCSLLHGSGAVNGFVNIIHKNGKDHPGSFLSMESGIEDGQVRMETGSGTSGNFGDLYLYLGTVKADSLDHPAQRADAFTEPSYRASLNWRKKNFTLTAFAQEEEFESGLTDPYANTVDGYPVVTMDSYAVMPQVKAEFTDTEDITFSLPLKYFKSSLNESGSSQKDRLERESQFKANLLFRSTRLDDHRIALGGSAAFYNRESGGRQYDFFTSPGGPGGPGLPGGYTDLSLDLSWLVLSAFMEDTVRVTSRLSLFGGVRYDSVHTRDFRMSVGGSPETDVDIGGSYDEVVTPRGGVTYELSPKQIVKLMYQRGYSYPDFGSQISLNKVQSIATEKVQSFEFGYHHTFDRLKGEFNLNAYYNIFTDTALQQFTEESGEYISDTVVVDRFAATGFEASFLCYPFGDIKAEISYAYARPYGLDYGELLDIPTDDGGDKWIIYPAHTVKLNLSKTIFDDRLEVVLGGLYNSSTSTLAGNNTTSGKKAAGAGREDVFDHHRFVVNAAARYRLTESLALTLRLKNILDNDVPAVGYYYDWGYYDKNASYTGPSAYIGLNWKF